MPQDQTSRTFSTAFKLDVIARLEAVGYGDMIRIAEIGLALLKV